MVSLLGPGAAVPLVYWYSEGDADADADTDADADAEDEWVLFGR